MSGIALEGLRTADEVAAGARASLYVLLANALSYPTPELARALTSGTLHEELEALAPSLPFSLQIGLVQPAVPGPSPEVVEQEYLRLFEVGPGRPPCPPYEGSHRRGRQEIMEDLVRFYEHFGVRHQPGDLPDHLCTELEFLHYLAFKEAADLQSGGDVQSYVLAQRDFLARHPVLWLASLRSKLEHMQALPLYISQVQFVEDACSKDLAFLEKRCSEGWSA
jgi:DMSO reductase family type II enzyme chaperone